MKRCAWVFPVAALAASGACDRQRGGAPKAEGSAEQTVVVYSSADKEFAELLYNTDHVKDAEAPRSILDLTKPRWKGRFAIANPHFGTTSFQIAALSEQWGDTSATEFLQRLKANGAVIATGNADVKDRVSDGRRIAVGILELPAMDAAVKATFGL